MRISVRSGIAQIAGSRWVSGVKKKLLHNSVTSRGSPCFVRRRLLRTTALAGSHFRPHSHNRPVAPIAANIAAAVVAAVTIEWPP